MRVTSLGEITESIAGFLIDLAGKEPIEASFVLGLFVALLTTLGSLPGLLGVRISDKGIDIGLSFSAGVMIVASFTSLLLPAIEIGTGFLPVVLGFLCGTFLIMMLDYFLPHEHFVKGYEGPVHLRSKVKTAWLVALAIIIHNFPEGMAIGASTAFDLKEGVLMAIAIGIQDMPEGFAVAFPIAVVRKKARLALLVSLLSGLSETLMSVITALLASVFSSLLPFFLSLAAGAMIYVVSHEIIPETHRKGHARSSTLGLILGFLIMLWLDTSLG